MKLNDGQSKAIDEILRFARPDDPRRFLSLCGPAGSGKTTLQKLVAEALGRKVIWTATTGKAARRLKEVIEKPTRTLHSALYSAPREIDNRRERRIELTFDEIKREDDRMICVDEASMVDRKILGDITKSPFRKVLLVGDGYQIPPVSDEAWSVFGAVEGPCLTEVMRAAGAVVEAATHVREGQTIYRSSIEHGGSRYDFTTDFREAFGAWFDDPEDHVLVTWSNAARMRLNAQIRHLLGRYSALPEPGEPVVVRKNDHLQGVMNGDVLYVDEWLGDGPEIAGIKTRYLRLRHTKAPPIPGGLDELLGDETIVKKNPAILVPLSGRDAPFDGSLPYVGLDEWNRGLANAGLGPTEGPIPISYAYCLTGHLVQGSQYRRTTTFLFNDLSNRNFRKPTTLPDGGTMPMAMRWTYTAVSRAKRHSTLVVNG